MAEDQGFSASCILTVYREIDIAFGEAIFKVFRKHTKRGRSSVPRFPEPNGRFRPGTVVFIIGSTISGCMVRRDVYRLQGLRKPVPYNFYPMYPREPCEIKLRRQLNIMPAEVFERLYVEHRHSDFHSGEAEDIADEYASFWMEIIEAMRSGRPAPLILTEHRPGCSEYVPGGFGIYKSYI